MRIHIFLYDKVVIATFPNFSKLTVEHQAEIQAITARFEPYSDFNFTSLFAWNTDGSTSVSLLNGNLIIRLPDYLTGLPIVSVIGDTNIDETLHTLLDHHQTLALVPEVVTNNVTTPGEFLIEEDRDNFDYIHSLQELAEMPGKSFKKKRNKANSVQIALGDRLVTVHTHRIDSSQKQELLDVFELWAARPDESDPSHAIDAVAEAKALQNLLEHSHHFNLELTSLYLDDKLVAFSINEAIHNHFLICHFEKALPVHEQIYAMLAKQAAKEPLSAGLTHVNWEQDLGIEGLRRSKLSYQPTKLLKKYTVRRAR